MKRMRFLRIVAMLFCVVLLFGLTAAPAYANSAQSHWTGIDSTGAIVIDENCPIEVEKELLTFYTWRVCWCVANNNQKKVNYGMV